ncbi:EamA family transporter [Acinetobacter sp. S40]|uniref:DMT family transporter n=1 Tax=Acinetobacter sp. S40 TaxID=2767434 RepID=UPI00190D00DA|nr:EamA family transporter [Acinetobacter sp. S40]MBJ9985852.1 EamA family transporter [Acinetobacter sp. S40]
MSNLLTKRFSLDYSLGLLAVLLAAFFWGTAGAAASFSKGLQPIAIATISVGVGGLIHTVLSLKAIRRNYKKILPFKTKIGLAIIVSILCPFAFYSSVSLAGVSIGTVVSIGCAPLFSVLLEWIFDHRKLSLKWLISFVFGLSGIILLSHIGTSVHEDTVVQSNRLLGILFGLLSSFSYASYSWIMKNLISHGVDSRAAMGLIFGICAVLVLPTLFITGTNLFTYPENLIVALYIPLVPMFLGYLFFSFGLKHIPASQAMTLALVEIPVATILAVFLVGESLTSQSYLGLFLIFLCVFVLSRK